MITVEVPRGDGSWTKETTIRIQGTCQAASSLGGQREYFLQMGEQLERALWESLPGGLYDALLAKMMTHRAELLVPPHAIYDQIHGKEPEP